MHVFYHKTTKRKTELVLGLGTGRLLQPGMGGNGAGGAGEEVGWGEFWVRRTLGVGREFAFCLAQWKATGRFQAGK